MKITNNKNNLLFLLFIASIPTFLKAMLLHDESDRITCYICLEEEFLDVMLVDSYTNEESSITSSVKTPECDNLIVHKIDKHIEFLRKLIQSYKHQDFDRLISMLPLNLKQDVFQKLDNKDAESKEHIKEIIFEEIHQELIFILKHFKEIQKYAKEVFVIIKEFIKLLASALKETEFYEIRDKIFKHPDFSNFILNLAFDGNNEAAEFLIDNPSIQINSNQRIRVAEMLKGKNNK